MVKWNLSLQAAIAGRDTNRKDASCRREARQKQGSKDVSNSEVLATAGTPLTLTVWMPATAGAHATSDTNSSGDASNCHDAKKARIYCR
jgi:hypothetical protein